MTARIWLSTIAYLMNNEQTVARIVESPAAPKQEQAAVAAQPTTPQANREAVIAATTVTNAEHASVVQEGPPRSIWREYFESAVVTVIMALFGMTFVVQAVKVPTGSMQNTILIGDHLLVNKFIFAPGPSMPFLPQRDIRRGDIIVFKYPGNKDNPERDLSDPTSTPFKTNFVKRVVGLPGDRLEVRGDQVLINGQVLPEHRITAGRGDSSLAPLDIINDPSRQEEDLYNVYYPPGMTQSPHGNFEDAFTDFRHGMAGRPANVPEGHYFVMGDNRNDSSDSRVWGFVRRDLIVGRAMFVYWSYDESALSSGNFISDFFTNTRWSRTGTLVK